MPDKHTRTDRQTEQHIREAIAMQRAFGDHAAQTFLQLRNVSPAVATRVLAAPHGQRRQF